MIPIMQAAARRSRRLPPSKTNHEWHRTQSATTRNSIITYRGNYVRCSHEGNLRQMHNRATALSSGLLDSSSSKHDMDQRTTKESEGSQHPSTCSVEEGSNESTILGKVSTLNRKYWTRELQSLNINIQPSSPRTWTRYTHTPTLSPLSTNIQHSIVTQHHQPAQSSPHAQLVNKSNNLFKVQGLPLFHGYGNTLQVSEGMFVSRRFFTSERDPKEVDKNSLVSSNPPENTSAESGTASRSRMPENELIEGEAQAQNSSSKNDSESGTLKERLGTAVSEGATRVRTMEWHLSDFLTVVMAASLLVGIVVGPVVVE
jgi:hypothetical protein